MAFYYFNISVTSGRGKADNERLSAWSPVDGWDDLELPSAGLGPGALD